MTVKLNLTIDEAVVKRAKRFAKQHNTSVSKLVEEYLEKSTKSTNQNGGKSFVEKYAGILNGKLSEKEVEKIKVERVKKKYGY